MTNTEAAGATLDSIIEKITSTLIEKIGQLTVERVDDKILVSGHVDSMSEKQIAQRLIEEIAGDQMGVVVTSITVN